MKKLLDDEARLRHILEAIAYTEEFLTDKTKDDFHNQPMLRFAVERQLEIIGEAPNRLSDSLKEGYPETEWRKIIAFRNFVVHEYFGVDVELLWDIASNKLAPLKVTVEQVLSDKFSI